MGEQTTNIVQSDGKEPSVENQQLRQALEARNEFFSVVTHELRDPLFSLQLSLQLLRRSAQKQGDIPSHVLDHLEVGERQAARLGRLIENLLDVSRIMNNRLQLDIEKVDVAALVRDTVQHFKAQAAAAHTPLGLDAADPAVGYFDRLKLEQIVGNLLSNAIKYGASRPVLARVHVQGDNVVVEVEDQGQGIAAADQQRVFQRFERASEGHRKESLGLGLYIVRSLVEAHHGRVSVRSEVGRGTTFSVVLPCQRLKHDNGQQQPGTGE